MKRECSCGYDCDECEQCHKPYCECTCDEWSSDNNDDESNEINGW